MKRLHNPLRSGFSGIIDQSLIAVTNLLLTFFAAQGGAASLGAFALVGALYFSLLILMRALVAEPFMAIDGSQFQHLYGTVSFYFAASGSIVSGLIAAIFFPMDVPWYLIPLLVCVLSLYEFVRIRAYVGGRQGIALAGSCLVLAFVAVAGILDSTFGADRWLHLSWYWLGGGFVGYVFISVSIRGYPSFRRGGWNWFRKFLLPKGKSLALDAVGIILVAHVGLFLINHHGSLGEVASVRAVTALLSPVSLVFTGLTVSLTPALAQADRSTHASTLRVFWVLILAASVTATIVVMLFGSAIIGLAFGPAAIPSYGTLLVAISSVVVFSLGTPLLAQVRVHGSYSIVAAIRVATGALTVLGLTFFIGGDLGLVFFSFQLGQAALILGGAWLALKHPSGTLRPVSRPTEEGKKVSRSQITPK